MTVDLPTMNFYIGFAQTVNTGAWELGIDDLGTGTVLGEALIYTFTDVSSAIRNVKLSRGKSRELDALLEDVDLDGGASRAGE